MSSPFQDRYWWFTQLQHDSCMRIEEELTYSASQQAAGYTDVRVREGVTYINLFGATPTTFLTPELSVEGIQGVTLRDELVLVPFNCLQHKVRIHLIDRHGLIIN